MYEFTHAGFWFRWSALDRHEKWYAGTSLAASAIAVAPIGAWVGHAGYALGHAAGSGTPIVGDAFPALAPWIAWWMIGFGLISGILWWRFSRLQDELFNRIQNWALAMSGVWTAVAVTIWGVLAEAREVPAMPPIAPFILLEVLILIFWPYAVRKWA